MARVAHKNLTGVNLHEPKGISTATANTVYIADGVGSGAFAKIGATQTDGTFQAGRVFLGSQTASSSASLGFVHSATPNNSTTITFDGTYKVYEFDFINLLPATDDQPIIVQIGTGGGPSYSGASYNFAGMDNLAGAAFTANNTTAWFIARATGSAISVSNVASEGGLCGGLRIFSTTSTAYHQATWNTVYHRADNTSTSVSGAGVHTATTALTAIRFLVASGNLTSGTIKAYGIRAS